MEILRALLAQPLAEYNYFCGHQVREVLGYGGVTAKRGTAREELGCVFGLCLYGILAVRLGRQLHPQGLHHRQRGLERRIPALAE